MRVLQMLRHRSRFLMHGVLADHPSAVAPMATVKTSSRKSMTRSWYCPLKPLLVSGANKCRIHAGDGTDREPAPCSVHRTSASLFPKGTVRCSQFRVQPPTGDNVLVVLPMC